MKHEIIEHKIVDWELFTLAKRKKPKRLDITFNSLDSLNYVNDLLEANWYFNWSWECRDDMTFIRSYSIKINNK